jgi:hypothetical protein
MTTARDRAQRRRQLAADAETAYDSFLSNVATPLVKQIANALQAEGYAFTLSTPGRGPATRPRSWPRRFHRARAGDRCR